MYMTSTRMFQILSRSHSRDVVGRTVDIAIILLIFANVAAVILETVPSFKIAYSQSFFIFEVVSLILFLIEYVLRIWSAVADPDQSASPAQKRWRYIFSFQGVIDFLAISPILVMWMIPLDLRILRIFRLVRILKLISYSDSFSTLIRAFRSERSAFGSALYLFLLSVLLSASMMYLVENEIQPEHFGSIPDALWWAMITLTTIGYGDVVPISILGKLIGGMTAILGVCTVAIMTGILSASIVSELQNRKDDLRQQMFVALDDGIVTFDENRALEALAKQLNIDEKEANILWQQVYRDAQIKKQLNKPD